MQESTRKSMQEIREIGGQWNADVNRRMESRADNLIASMNNLSDLIRQLHDEKDAEDLISKLIASMKANDPEKFRRALRNVEKSRS